MAAALSDEDFNRLQNQLIELRTQNYEIDSKLHKSQNDQAILQEKCNSQEKEIQKLSKLMKFPGFQAITKSKSKKDLQELLEENERLNQQMQRHEDDFKLQNQTLLQEVSRLSAENEELQKSSHSTSLQDNDEYRRLKAENSVLQQTIQELSKETVTAPSSQPDTIAENDNVDIYSKIDNTYEEMQLIIENVLNLSKTSSPETNLEQDFTDSVPRVNKDDTMVELRESMDKCINSLKTITSSKCTLPANSNNNTDHQIKLQTALHETQMLQEQLNSVKSSSKQEVQQLRQEVEKWSEKARKKQESFTKLQDEKEKMYEANRLAQNKLKDDSIKKEKELQEIINNLEATLQSKNNDNKVDDLQGQLDVIRSENQAMQTELIALKEKHRIDQSEKIKDLENRLESVTNERDTCLSQIQELSSKNESLSCSIEDVQKNASDMKTQLSQANELADKRKKLLDESSLERHKDIENNQSKLQEVKERFEKEIQNLVTKHNEEIEDLKKQITNHKKLKKELEETKQRNISLEEQVESMDKKSGWLERSLKETEEKMEKSQKEHEEQIDKLEAKMKTDKEELDLHHTTVIKELEDSFKKLEIEKNEQLSLAENLKQAAKDREVEYRIANKKTDHLIKDLKRQLNGERKRADQLQMKLQDFIQEVKVKQTYDEIFNPESLQLKIAAGHRRQDSGSHLSLVSSISGADNEDAGRSLKTSSPVESSTNLSGLSDETMDLISRIADLQQQKWLLEERVRHLEENGAAMADDLMQKSLVIQAYVMENKADTTPQRRRSLTLKEKMMDKLKLHNNEELNREINAKMQRMLEETLARNAQLQQDVDLLSKELQTATQKS
ncbi:GRIP1-associated protein 1-like isoform X2 [Hydractinia symbiolongicarpus]|uniref:GRIP1-associated protein 1-like isoform X2 n=1 Tax=Hydractinia symbiolongicarpus TaxID=13093 RepID=UPI00254C826C|nr:GRIP1-associated protein 1-like isoform X2 [Hydractinia symbiolongicarpus]